MEAPDQLPRANIEGTHVTARALRLCVGDGRPGDDQVFKNERRRGHAIKPVRVALSDAGPQVDRSIISEAGDGLAIRRTQSKEPAVKSPEIGPLVISPAPESDPTVDEEVV